MTDARVLVVGSKNPDKAAEIAAILTRLPLEVKPLSAFGPVDDVEETGDTFEANAILKAEAFARATGQLAMADDSGLCVDALDGAPGVYSARYAGPGCTYADNNRKLLHALTGKPESERGARFVCTIACATSDGTWFTVSGRVDGHVAITPAGTHGFGYDPVFFHPPSGKTFAELSSAEKNCVSHRAVALAAFKAELTKRLAEG